MIVGRYATAMNNVATLYQAIGRYTQAEPLLLEASKIQQRTLGDDHPHTVASLSNLATVYQAMGEEARARRVLTCAWAIERIGVLMVGASRAAATAPPGCTASAAAAP